MLQGVRVLYAGMARATDGERATSQGLAERGLLDYLRILWRHKLLIALTVVVATGAAVGLDRVRTRTYQGTAEVLFTFQGTSDPSSSSDLSPADVATDIELIQSAPVQAAVAKELRTTAPPVTATEVGTTNVAQIVVRSTSPDFAAAAANGYARAYILVATQGYIKSQLATEKQIQVQILAQQQRINTILQTPGYATSAPLQAQLADLEPGLTSLQQQLYQLQVTTAQGASAGQLVVPAVPDPVPVSPKPLQDAVIAGGVGLLLGIGFALLRENLDDRVRGKDQLEQLMPGIPVLGLIPVIDGWRDRKRPYLVAQTQPRSPPSEAYRGLRTSVRFMALENPTKVLQITSPSAGDGKTTTSANLAWIMADAGQRVVLIGCDLRQPRIHDFFGLPNDVGFTSVLLGEAELDDALLWVPNQPNLLMLPTGPVPPNPSELLSSARTQQVFKSLSAYADMVIVDSAPVLPVTDAAVLSTHADAILLVVSVGMDKRRDVVQSVEMLNQINAPVAGIVLNRAIEADSSAYYRYGYEEKSSHKGKPKDDKQRGAPAPTNGNGKVAHDLSPGPPDMHVEFVKNLPAMEDENLDWPARGRHAKVTRPPLSDSPTLSLPQTGDADDDDGHQVADHVGEKVGEGLLGADDVVVQPAHPGTVLGAGDERQGHALDVAEHPGTHVVDQALADRGGDPPLGQGQGPVDERQDSNRDGQPDHEIGVLVQDPDVDESPQDEWVHSGDDGVEDHDGDGDGQDLLVGDGEGEHAPAGTEPRRRRTRPWRAPRSPHRGAHRENR